MAKPVSMGDLLAKQQPTNLRLTRNQQTKGEVISISDQEVVLDLGSKAEGVLPKKELSDSQKNLKIGDKLDVYVLIPENESGQVVLTLQKSFPRGESMVGKLQKLQQVFETSQTLSGQALEVNKGGLIVDIGGVRGFLPTSQINFSSASNLEDLIGKKIEVSIIELDPSQNRLILSQKSTVTDEEKTKLKKIKVGDRVKGKVVAILPFGIFISIEEENLIGLEGLVHSSEISWEKVENPLEGFRVGQEVKAVVSSIDSETGRVNLSIKKLQEDPFLKLSQKYSGDDVVKGTVIKVTNLGITIELEKGVEGMIPASKLDPAVTMDVGQKVTVLVDSVDALRHRINLAPFITSTKGLIYK